MDASRVTELAESFDKGLISKDELHELFKHLVESRTLDSYPIKYTHMAQYLASKGVVVLDPTEAVLVAEHAPVPWRGIGITLLIVMFLIVICVVGYNVVRGI